jgi:hypothetical protein
LLPVSKSERTSSIKTSWTRDHHQGRAIHAPCPAGQNYLEGDNIKNIISHAFDDAYDLLAELGVNIVLEKKK